MTARKYAKIPLVTTRAEPLRSVSPPHWRPETRADCHTFDRPWVAESDACPYVGCRHHLDNDEHDAGHEPRVTIDRLSDVRPSCSLDVAERPPSRKRPPKDGVQSVDIGCADLDEIAALTGLWHTAVEDALASGLVKMAADPDLREMFADLMERDDGHPLAQAQQWADAAPDVDE